jgi:hypothetical protein
MPLLRSNLEKIWPWSTPQSLDVQRYVCPEGSATNGTLLVNPSDSNPVISCHCHSPRVGFSHNTSGLRVLKEKPDHLDYRTRKSLSRSDHGGCFEENIRGGIRK